MQYYQCMGCHYKDYAILRRSRLYNENLHTRKGGANIATGTGNVKPYQQQLRHPVDSVIDFLGLIFPLTQPALRFFQTYQAQVTLHRGNLDNEAKWSGCGTTLRTSYLQTELIAIRLALDLAGISSARLRQDKAISFHYKCYFSLCVATGTYDTMSAIMYPHVLCDGTNQAYNQMYMFPGGFFCSKP